ncbi:MAG: hypothetical protein M3R67_06965 [Acidobacteriota bacterium]|nr:hypothetical protein [Acidobacteriota bacterium]
MTQHIGIVAGSAEGAALCYRTICLEAPAIMGEHNHPEITMNSAPMAQHIRHIRANDWEALGPIPEALEEVSARAHHPRRRRIETATSYPQITQITQIGKR